MILNNPLLEDLQLFSSSQHVYTRTAVIYYKIYRHGQKSWYFSKVIDV